MGTIAAAVLAVASAALGATSAAGVSSSPVFLAGPPAGGEAGQSDISDDGSRILLRTQGPEVLGVTAPILSNFGYWWVLDEQPDGSYAARNLPRGSDVFPLRLSGDGRYLGSRDGRFDVEQWIANGTFSAALVSSPGTTPHLSDDGAFFFQSSGGAANRYEMNATQIVGVTRVDVSELGVPANASSAFPLAANSIPTFADGVSDDGNRAIFSSAATNLHPAAFDGSLHWYVKDLTTGEVWLLPDAGWGLSGDGSTAMIVTTASLLPADTDTAVDLYLYDLAAETLEMPPVPASLTGSELVQRPDISDSADRVTLKWGNSNYLWDRQAGTIEPVIPTGAHPDGEPGAARISGDGSTVVYSVYPLTPTNGLHLDRVFVLELESDQDGDGVEDGIDNCPEVFNPDQADTDGDGIGDVCEGDVTPPIVSAVVPNPDGANGWHVTAPVVIGWDVVDPEPSAGGVVAPPPTIAPLEGMHVYESDEVCDAVQNCAAGSATLSIDTVAPVVDSVGFSVNPKAITETSTMTVGVSDATSGIDIVEYRLDGGGWSPLPVTLGSATVDFDDSLLAGVHQVDVRTRDVAGNTSDVSTSYLVVYDPSGAWATGGGWFVPGGPSSDPGDLLPGLDGTSKAHFGFSVRYQTGASTVPAGDLQFRYIVPGQGPTFVVEDAGFDSLVVTNNTWAKFQGLVTVDGTTGLHPVHVDARDANNQPDRFIIKIWAPGADPDVDDPIYRASGDLSGGNIKIHN